MSNTKSVFLRWTCWKFITHWKPFYSPLSEKLLFTRIWIGPVEVRIYP